MISEHIGLMSYIGFSCLHRTPELTTIRRVYTVGLQLTQNALRNAVRWTTRHLMWDVTGGYVLRVGTHYPCSRAVLTSRTVNEWTSPRVSSFWHPCTEHSWTRALPDNALSTRPVFTVTTRDDGCSTHYTVFTGSVYRASRRRAAGAELGEGIRPRRRSEDGVFQLQLTVSRRQVLNLLLQQLDFLAHSEQQVTLHQILRRQQPEYTYFILFYFSNHFISAPRSCKIK